MYPGGVQEEDGGEEHDDAQAQEEVGEEADGEGRGRARGYRELGGRGRRAPDVEAR